MIVNYSDYLTGHATNVCLEVVLIALMPLYTIVVVDPVLEVNSGATASYKIECYAFYSKAVGRSGETQCTSYRWAGSCWDVIQAVNTRTCGLEGSYASTGRYFYTYSMVSEILGARPFTAPRAPVSVRISDSMLVAVATVIVLVAAGLLCIAAVYLYTEWWDELLKVSFLLQYFASITAVGLAYTTAAAVDAATFSENNGIGQKVYVDAGLIATITLTITELLLSNTVTVWYSK